MSAAEEKRAERTITVAASASVAAEPDLALISTGVISDAVTAKDALATNTAAMRNVIDTLKASGIDAKDIRTVSFNVEPRYEHYKDGRAPRITGYRVHNMVRITAREIGRLGEVLDKVVGLGANQIGGIEFRVSKAEELKDEARRQAMANALRRAKLYAQSVGADVGPALTISEEMIGPSPRPMPMARTQLAEAAPIEPGSQALEARVNVVFALK